MADINFSNLNLEHQINVVPIQKKGMTIEVKQYLPIIDKIHVIETVINNCLDDHNFANLVNLNVHMVCAMTEAYTNLVFSDEDKENIGETYDLLSCSGLWHDIVEHIPESEYNFIVGAVKETIQEIYKYKESVLGILDAINADYKDLNLNAETIREKLANKEGVEFLNEVMEKMG